jgi:tagatose 6-phosphate kinase
MILSIDLNPVVKRKYNLGDIELYNLNMAETVNYGPGGYGIELAYFLSGLNENVIVSGFLGGVNGNFIEKELHEAHIINEFYRIKDETADSIIISTNNGDTQINTRGPRITRDELGGYIEHYNRLIFGAEIICIAGNMTNNISKDIYYDLVKRGGQLNKKVLIALGGDELYYALEGAPYLAVIQRQELENLTKLKLDYEYEIIKAGQYILDKGVSIVVIPVDNKGSIVLTTEYIYRVNVPEIDIQPCSVNNGYMLGGFSLSIERNYDFDMMLRIGQSCGIINCYKHNSSIDMSDIKRIMGEIEIGRYNH